jgi:hypothetical protein
MNVEASGSEVGPDTGLGVEFARFEITGEVRLGEGLERRKIELV